MFEDYREDATQDLFSQAIRIFERKPCYAFKNNGIVVFTSDQQLLKILADMEQESNNENCENDEEPKKVHFLDFGDFKLNPNQKIPMSYSNCIFFEQESCRNGFGYGSGTAGGGTTIMLADSMKKLTRLIKPIVDKHVSDFHIDFNNNTPCVDPIVPLLAVKSSVNNRLIEGLNNDGLYCSKLLLRAAIYDLTEAIHHAENKQPDNEKQRSL